MEELIADLTPYMTPSPFDDVAKVADSLPPYPPTIAATATATAKTSFGTRKKDPPPVKTSNPQTLPPPARQMSLMTPDPLIRCLAELHPPTFSKIINLQIHNTYSDARFKLSFIDALRMPENKPRLWARDSRFATLDAVETDLGKSTPIKLATFLTLCRLLNIEPFIIVYKCARYVYTSASPITTPAPERALVYSDIHPHWTVKHVPTAADETTTYIIGNILKPYKAISSYTAPELKALCAQLGLDNEKTKPALYADIKQYFSELM